MNQTFLDELTAGIDVLKRGDEAQVFVDAVTEALAKKFVGTDLAAAEMLIRIDQFAGRFVASTNDVGIDLFMAKKMSRYDIVAGLQQAGYDYKFDSNRGCGWISIKLPASE